ncbi:Ubiquitin carboxyl-terminal hydrolase 7 [Anthophora plagiata]
MTTINIGIAMNHVTDQENLEQVNLAPVQVNEVEEMDTQEGDEARSEATFRYTVENLSKMKETQLSPPCYVRNLPWKIMVMPRSSQAQDRAPQKSLGFFLQCNGESDSSWSCYAVADLRLLSCKEGQDPFNRKIQHLFYSKENDWGFSHFMTWQDDLDPDKEVFLWHVT